MPMSGSNHRLCAIEVEFCKSDNAHTIIFIFLDSVEETKALPCETSGKNTFQSEIAFLK